MTMEEKDLQSITVAISGRSYPLRVDSKDVDLIQQVTREINEKIREFQLSYKNRDLQDFLVMTLLTYAVDFHRAKDATGSDMTSDRLIQLNKTLEEALS